MCQGKSKRNKEITMKTGRIVLVVAAQKSNPESDEAFLVLAAQKLKSKIRKKNRKHTTEYKHTQRIQGTFWNKCNERIYF